MAYSIAFSQAISILAYINIASERENCKYLSIKDLSNKLAIPVPSIKRIISMLKKSGLLITKTGVNGGLSLSRDSKDTSLLDIFQSIEGVSPLFKIYDGFNFNTFKNKDEVKQYLSNEKQILRNVKYTMLNKLKASNLDDVIGKNTK